MVYYFVQGLTVKKSLENFKILMMIVNLTGKKLSAIIALHYFALFWW